MTITIPPWIVAVVSSWWFGLALGLSVGLGLFLWFMSKVRFWA